MQYPGRSTERRTRRLGALCLIGVAVTHATAVEHKLADAPYMGVMFLGLITASVLLAAALLAGLRERLVWAMSGGLAGSAILGYVVARSVALPQMADHVGHWVDAAGLASIFFETILVGLALRQLVSVRPRIVTTAAATFLVAGYGAVAAFADPNPGGHSHAGGASHAHSGDGHGDHAGAAGAPAHAHAAGYPQGGDHEREGHGQGGHRHDKHGKGRAHASRSHGSHSNGGHPHGGDTGAGGHGHSGQDHAGRDHAGRDHDTGQGHGGHDHGGHAPEGRGPGRGGNERHGGGREHSAPTPPTPPADGEVSGGEDGSYAPPPNGEQPPWSASPGPDAPPEAQ